MAYNRRWSRYGGRNKKTYPQHKGWVYVLSNPTFPELVKVGYTDKPVERRIDELNDTAIPTPFTKEYEALVNGANEVEKKAHSLLSEYKYKKEFFKCTPQVAVNAIKRAADGLGKEIHHDEAFFSDEYFSEESAPNKRIRYYASGKKYSETPIKNGKANGVAVGWHENGNKRFEVPCKDGEKNGLEFQWYETGEKSCEVPIKNGKKEGLQIQWYKSGVKKSETKYKNDNFVEASVKWWNEEGEPSDKYLEPLIKVVDWNNFLVREGVHYEKDSDGIPAKTPFTGKQVGTTSCGHKSEWSFKDGIAHGLAVGWYPNGQKQGETNWKDGVEDGLHVDWYENGQKREEINYKDGEIVSEKYWNPEGEPMDKPDDKDFIIF